MRYSGFAAAFIAAALAACAVAPASAQDVRVLGRADVNGDGSFAVQWSGSGFEAEFTGSKLYAQISDWGLNIYRIEIDGMEATLELEDGLKTYLLYDGVKGRHTLRMTRRTSADAGPTYFNYIRANGKLRPTEAPERRMLVIGDDNVTGYGVLGESDQCGFSYETQDHGHAFGAITADFFGAELQTIAADGRGLTRNYEDSGAPTMAALLLKTLPDSQRVWSAHRYTPDVVVVDLGTADFWDGDPGEGFDEAYVGLLADLRRDYPDAYVFTSVGPQHYGERRDAMVGSIRGAVAARVALGDEKVEYIDLPLAAEGRILGCHWHAGIDSQLHMAGLLAERISDRLGWDIGGQDDEVLLSQVRGVAEAAK